MLFSEDANYELDTSIRMIPHAMGLSSIDLCIHRSCEQDCSLNRWTVKQGAP